MDKASAYGAKDCRLVSKVNRGGTRYCSSGAQMQSPLFCDSDQAISRGIQWNKLLELLDRKGFEKSKARLLGTPGT